MFTPDTPTNQAGVLALALLCAACGGQSDLGSATELSRVVLPRTWPEETTPTLPDELAPSPDGTYFLNSGVVSRWTGSEFAPLAAPSETAFFGDISIAPSGELVGCYLEGSAGYYGRWMGDRWEAIEAGTFEEPGWDCSQCFRSLSCKVQQTANSELLAAFTELFGEDDGVDELLHLTRENDRVVHTEYFNGSHDLALGYDGGLSALGNHREGIVRYGPTATEDFLLRGDYGNGDAAPSLHWQAAARVDGVAPALVWSEISIEPDRTRIFQASLNRGALGERRILAEADGRNGSGEAVATSKGKVAILRSEMDWSTGAQRLVLWLDGETVFEEPSSFPQTDDFIFISVQVLAFAIDASDVLHVVTGHPPSEVRYRTFELPGH